MRPTHAIRLGLRRGWLEFVQSIRSSQDQGFYLFTAFLSVGYLFLRRNTEIEGTDLLLPSVALPSILGAFIAFGVVIGPAYTLAMEKEDGTLLDFDYQEVRVSQAIIHNARKVFLAADSSKFGRSAMTRLGSLEQIDCLFTDSAPSEVFAELLARHKVQLEIAE